MNDDDRQRGRGRPRSVTAERAILQAARALLEEGGLSAVTMEAVAARAGVGKPTIYRWWPDRHAVAMAALIAGEATPPRAAARRSALGALADQLRTIGTRFSSKTGRHVTTIIAAADADSELSKAFRNHFVLARRTEGRALLERAIAQGEARADIDTEVVLDLLYGPIFFRLLMGHAPLETPFTDKMLQELLLGVAPTKTISPSRGARRKKR